MKNNRFKRVAVEDECVRSDEVLTVDAFRKRMRIGDFAWRKLRKKLPVKVEGRKCYIEGQAWLDYVANLPPDFGDENGTGKHGAKRNGSNGPQEK